MRDPIVRLLSLVAAAALALAPAYSEARGFGRGGGRRGSSSSSGSSSGSSSSSPSSGSSGFGRSGSAGGSGSGGWRTSRGYHSYGEPHGYGYGYGGTVVYGGPSYYDPYYHPYYSTWGVYPYGYYAYGYYPYWGAPSIAEAPAAPSETSFSLHLGGMFAQNTFLPGASLAIDGRHWGFNAQGMVLGSVAPDGFLDPMPFFSGHVTYSLIADPHMRVRLELGATGVVAPDFSYYGPDLGSSVQLALLGPLSLEGALHLTPFPARVLDLDAGVGLHFGALGLKFGYRVLRLDDRAAQRGTDNGGVDLVNGWQAGVGIVY